MTKYRIHNQNGNQIVIEKIEEAISPNVLEESGEESVSLNELIFPVDLNLKNGSAYQASVTGASSSLLFECVRSLMAYPMQVIKEEMVGVDWTQPDVGLTIENTYLERGVKNFDSTFEQLKRLYGLSVELLAQVAGSLNAYLKQNPLTSEQVTVLLAMIKKNKLDSLHIASKHHYLEIKKDNGVQFHQMYFALRELFAHDEQLQLGLSLCCNRALQSDYLLKLQNKLENLCEQQTGGTLYAMFSYTKSKLVGSSRLKSIVDHTFVVLRELSAMLPEKSDGVEKGQVGCGLEQSSEVNLLFPVFLSASSPGLEAWCMKPISDISLPRPDILQTLMSQCQKKSKQLQQMYDYTEELLKSDAPRVSQRCQALLFSSWLNRVVSKQAKNPLLGEVKSLCEALLRIEVSQYFTEEDKHALQDKVSEWFPQAMVRANENKSSCLAQQYVSINTGVDMVN